MNHNNDNNKNIFLKKLKLSVKPFFFLLAIVEPLNRRSQVDGGVGVGFGGRHRAGGGGGGLIVSRQLFRSV